MLSPRLSRLLTTLALLAILAGAAGLRLSGLTPPARGLDFAADTDEGAYALSAQLLLQGQLPYRDFFATLPPLALYLFAGVQGLFYRPWGSLAGFMALRYASVAYGLATIVAVYFIGRRLGGWPAGLLAAALLAGDGIVAGQDRRAMLEAPMNLFSALAVWAYLHGMSRERAGRWLALAGALSAAAVMVRSQAAVLPLVLLGATLARRRWRDALSLFAGGVGAGLLLAGPFLLLCPEPFLKQVYVFQLVRPPDGPQGIIFRLHDIWNYPAAWLTVRVGLLGLIVGTWGLWRTPARAGWLLTVAWAGGTAALLLLSKSYWATYVAPLAVPLALLAGGALAGRRAPTLLGRLAPAGLLLVFSLWALTRAPTQADGARRFLTAQKPEFGQVMRYLERYAAPEATVLATDPLYALTAGRPPARGAGRPYLADSYGGMLYRNLGLAELTWQQLWTLRWADTTEEVFARPPAQEDVLAAFAAADYVVIDWRARRQWAFETLRRIDDQSTAVLTLDDVVVRRRNAGDVNVDLTGEEDPCLCGMSKTKR